MIYRCIQFQGMDVSNSSKNICRSGNEPACPGGSFFFLSNFTKGFMYNS